MKKKVIISTIVGAMLLSGTAMAATVAWNGHATILKVRAQLESVTNKLNAYEGNEGALVSKYTGLHTQATTKITSLGQTITAWESTYYEEAMRAHELELQVAALQGQLATAQGEAQSNGDGVAAANADVEGLGNLSDKVASATEGDIPLTGDEINALPVLP